MDFAVAAPHSCWNRTAVSVLTASAAAMTASGVASSGRSVTLAESAIGNTADSDA